jgi:hypothetical protein
MWAPKPTVRHDIDCILRNGHTAEDCSKWVKQADLGSGYESNWQNVRSYVNDFPPVFDHRWNGEYHFFSKSLSRYAGRKYQDKYL